MTQYPPWETVRVLRIRSGYSLSALAREAGMSKSHLSVLERGGAWPSPAITRRLADALKVPYTTIERSPLTKGA